MFTGFFYTLKEKKVPVTLTEWLTLIEALSRGYVTTLNDFYYLARAVLVKNENQFDQYDLAFKQYFEGIESREDIREEIFKWLSDPSKTARNFLSPEELASLKKLDFDELLKEFQKRLNEQTEAHDGGSHWIGRFGTSPFGHSGQNPAGIRVGGPGGGRSAIQIASERRYANYRSDLTLDIRQIKVALKSLRKLSRVGPEDELDLETTIDATCRNAGDIDLKWKRSRKNSVKMLLLMDAGGSMDPYADLVSRLFSAASSVSYFKDFKYYYFHNCVYDSVYKNMERNQKIATEELLRTYDRDYRVVMVGDAAMAPYELTRGPIYYYEYQDGIPGVVWLKRIKDHFSHGVWLNPEPRMYWNQPTVVAIGKLFPMFELTIDGLGDAVRQLLVKK